MRAGLSRFSGAASPPSKGRQLIVKNLNDLLAGRDAPQDFLAQRLVFDPRDEILRDLKIDIGLQQRETHLPQRVVDIGFADRPMTAKVLEDVLKLVAELRKHDDIGGGSPAISSSFSARPLVRLAWRSAVPWWRPGPAEEPTRRLS